VATRETCAVTPLARAIEADHVDALIEETADIALLPDDLSQLPFTVSLSRAALNTIRVNIAFSLGIKLIAVLAVFPGWLTLWLAILADMGASVLGH